MDCTQLSSYRGDPALLFSACCPGQPTPQPAPASAAISSCPAIGNVTAGVKRLSEQTVTCTYAPSPLWAAQRVPEESAAREQVCAFLSAAVSGTPRGSRALVHLSGESAEAPAFLARWRDFAGQEGLGALASPPESDADCEAAMESLRPAYAEFLTARMRAEAGRLLPALGDEERQAGKLYRDHDAWAGDWAGQVGLWQARLSSELEDKASALKSARAVALASCFPVEPPGAPRLGHVGAFGRTMGELLTSGLDAGQDQLRPERASAEDAALNGEGAVMCSALPALLLEGQGSRWWEDPAEVRACFPGVGSADAKRLGELLDGPDPRVLDAFRLVRSWLPAQGGAAEGGSAACEGRAASLHRALHTLAVFYHGSSFFRLAGPEGAFPQACRMTEAERRTPWYEGTAEASPASCSLGVSSLCASLPNGMYARPGALGHGLLQGMVTPSLLDGSLLSVKGAPSEDNELNVALARALASNKQRVCEREQWAGARADEFGNVTEAPNFCRRDLSAPWLFSTDPGRGGCGRARAMVEGTPLSSSLYEFPFTRPSPNDPAYCPRVTDPTADPARNDEACCCDVSHYMPDVQICFAKEGSFFAE